MSLSNQIVRALGATWCDCESGPTGNVERALLEAQRAFQGSEGSYAVLMHPLSSLNFPGLLGYFDGSAKIK